MPGVSGTTDATGTDARFNTPVGAGLDSAGNLYVADSGGKTIRKVTPSGVVTTFAGSPGLSGTTDGTGADARFTYPYGIAVDSEDNIYVTDNTKHTIRKITPAGVVTTLAGSPGLSGTTDGLGSDARFKYPTGIAVHGDGTLYVADSNNFTIRTITPEGLVSTLAGVPGVSGSTDGSASTAKFYYPKGIAVDAAKNVYVGDGVNYTIRKITAGVVSTVAGAAGTSGSKDDLGTAARFANTSALALDNDGNLYVTDAPNYTIRKMTVTGNTWMVMTIGGTATVSGTTDGTGGNARFKYPTGIAINNAGDVYIVDQSAHRISVGSCQLAPSLTSEPEALGTAGVWFSYAITASNNPASYDVVGLPPGLSVNTATGLISGTPEAGGDYSVTISASNGGGTATGTLTLSIQNSYSGWKNLHFTPEELADPAISGYAAAPAGDGIANLLKYALNLDPWSPSFAGLPTPGITTVSGTDYLSLTYTPAPLVDDITFLVEVSGDLNTWNSGPGFTLPVDTENPSTVTVQDATPMSSAPRRFIRLKITNP
jgi:sugar lactone lactonase YvrE